jgi:hypothetical protein
MAWLTEFHLQQGQNGQKSGASRAHLSYCHVTQSSLKIITRKRDIFQEQKKQRQAKVESF